jgi:hypothetical protein
MENKGEGSPKASIYTGSKTILSGDKIVTIVLQIYHFMLEQWERSPGRLSRTCFSRLVYMESFLTGLF